jgi:hypothetical protein
MGRLAYTVGQRMGSHHVHGTWMSLLSHYLEEEEGKEFAFRPRGHGCETHINQYIYVSQVVFRALSSYVNYVLDADAADAFIKLFESTDRELMKLYTEAIGGDLGA